MAVLDKDGLSRLWANIKAYFVPRIFSKGSIGTLTPNADTKIMANNGDVAGTITPDGILAQAGITSAMTFDQGVKTTDSPHFANINPPVDNTDASMPSVGIGGFSYAENATGAKGAYPSITIGSGGTWVYIAESTRNKSTSFVTIVGRIAGGSSVQGYYEAGDSFLEAGLLHVIAWRIA